MIEIIFLDIDLTQKIDNYTKCYGYINKERIIRIEKFKRNDDKLRCLFSGLLLYYSCKKRGLDRDKIIVKYGKYGKPIISEFFFSISHSGNKVAIAISDQIIGFDLEKIDSSKIFNLLNILGCREYDYFFRHKNKVLAFYEIWTAKEALLKYSGEGLVGLDSAKDIINELQIGNLKTQQSGDYIWSIYHNELNKEKVSLINMSVEKFLRKIF